MNMKFTLPIIVISTITGTANFAQETFPVSWQQYVPLGIGGLNLVAAIATTVLQFLKANELMEAHRVASVAYGKLSRDIKLELGLPVTERKSHGSDLIIRCSSDYDRLIEQAPPVPGDILDKFNRKYKSMDNINKPEITEIKPITLFDQLAENAIVKNVKNMFVKKTFSKPRGSDNISNIEHRISIYKSDDDEFGKKQQEKIASELEMLKNRNLVTIGSKAVDVPKVLTDDEIVEEVLDGIIVENSEKE